ncbi:MAG: LamG domain-containing protein, partial [Patescibacteria group bacterium]|nr:LamG domain-containing protein [Patescibacteria group bacterium]
MNKKLLFGLLFFTALVLAGQTNTTASVTLLTTNDLDCWFDPIYQEPTNLRYVYCNYTNSDNDPILGATITHETFDTNDWFAGEYTTTNDEQGKIIGYHNVQNISDNDINFSNTYKITNTTRAHIRFGSWQFPQETKQMWTSIWLKAGSTATQFRTMVCNGTYADEVMDNTPFYYNRTANYNNCTLANVTDLNKTIINYNNWTRLDIDITDAYNSVAGIQEGQQNFSVHFSTYDDFEINATGWSISSIWLPPNYNETKSAYNFSSTSLFQTPYPDNQEDDSDDSGINMTGNVLLFSLNESSGNIVDYSGNGHTGTAQGTLAYSQGGQVDKSLYWDGDSGTRIDVADDSSLDLQTEMTLMFWIYQENPSDQPDWITKGVYYESYATWGDTSATYFVTNGNSLAGSAVPSEEWHHVAFIKNSSGRYFYIDGELDTSDTYTTNTELVSDPLYFSSSSYPFEGKMDEIALFDRSLSTSEVENVYNKQLKKFMPYSEMSYPDNGNYTTFYNNDNYLEFYGDSDYSADGDYLHFNADNAEYAIMKNVSMFDGLEQSDLTACVFFKRDDMSYSNHERLFSFSNHLRLSLTPNTGATTGHNVQCRIRTDEGGVVVAGTTNEPINDTVWHHACCVRDTENEIIHLILDGDDVDEQTVAEANNLSAISQGFFGSDTANIGGGNHFNGTLAHFFFHNDSHTLTEIAQGIDSSYWMYAVSDDSWTESDVYARGSWHNDTHYSWDEIGDYAPVMYLKYWNQISNMTYNATNELYYDIYNTSQDQMATTQNSEGVNYTAFFNASHPNYESKNESEYYYVKGVSTANCSVEIGWNNASETGQYQLARINWTYTSNIPFTTKKVVFCENGESGEECYEYSGNALTFHHRMKNYGEATVYCEVQNDFMTESFVNYTPDNLTVGCWSAYGHYDGTKGSLELESDLHVCSGTHQMISMLDDSVLKNPGTGYAMSLEGPTIFDGGNSRGTHSTDSDYRTMLWGYDLEDKQQNPNGNLKIQNGDIGFLFAGNLTDSYFANYEFENMSIAFRLEDTIGNNFSIINNTFINTGIDKGSSIWTSGQNLTLQFNDFSDLNSTAVGHVVCSGCSNTVLEQNYYSDVGDLEIYVTTTRNIDTQIGSMGCEVGTWGAQHPYSNSTTYTNNASIFGEIYDEYPCTTRSVCGTITEDVTLEADLNVSTSGYCFVIGADDITIDCDGYTVIRVSSGAGSPFINDGAYDGLTLKNCFVQNFPAVVYIGGDYASSINNTFYNITNQAIALSGGKYYSSHSNNISYSGTGINAWGSVYSITIWNETWHDNDRAFYLRGFLNGLVVGESTFDNTVLIEDLPVNSYVKARFVNTTYTGSIDFTDDDSELDVEWYVDVLVQDTSSVALPGAAVEAYDNTTANIFSDVTE